MTTISRSALVPYTPAQMFALVTDIESYPEFLPWCRSARILSRSEDEIKATLEIAKGGIHKSFTTRNRHQQNKMVAIHLVEGPFRQLEGFWRFDELGNKGSKISLDLEFDFSSRLLGMMVGPVFTQIADTLVDSFQQRARQVYGRQ